MSEQPIPKPSYEKIYALYGKLGISPSLDNAKEWGERIANDPNFAKTEYKALSIAAKRNNQVIPDLNTFQSRFDPLKKKESAKPVTGSEDGLQPPQGSGEQPLQPTPTGQPTIDTRGIVSENLPLVPEGAPRPTTELDIQTKKKSNEIRERMNDWTYVPETLGAKKPTPPTKPEKKGMELVEGVLGKPEKKGLELVESVLDTKPKKPIERVAETIGYTPEGQKYKEELKTYEEELKAYEEEVAKFEEKYPVLTFPKKEIESVQRNREKAKQMDMTVKDLFNATSQYMEQEFLTPEFEKEKRLVDQLYNAEKAYLDLVKNPEAYGATDPSKKAEQIAILRDNVNNRKEELARYRKATTIFADNRIAELQAQLVADPDNQEIRSEIARMKALKQQFISEESVAGIINDRSFTGGKITSIDQFRELYMGWYTERNELLDELGLKGKWNKTVYDDFKRGFATNVGWGYDEKKVERLMELEDKLRVGAPAALVNRNPSSVMQMGAGERFAGGLVDVLSPARVSKKLTPEAISNEVVNLIANYSLPVGEENVVASQERAEGPSALSGKGFAGMLGTTVGIMVPFAVGAAAIRGVSAALTLVPTLARFATAFEVFATSNKFGRIVYPAIKSGAEYEAVGQIFKANPLVSDEGNFAAGFLGNLGAQAVLGVPAQKAISAAYVGLFGKNAAKAFEATTKFGRALRASGELIGTGLGESAEEYGNEMGSIYRDSDTWAEAKGLIEQRFGTLSQNVEFIVSTALLGAGMGAGSIIGKYAAQDFAKAMEAASPEERAQVNEILNDIMDDPAINEIREEVENEVKAQEDANVKKQAERDKRDKQIEEFIAPKFPEETNEGVLLDGLERSTDVTLDRVADNLPVDNVAIESAIANLDKKFEELERYKDDPARMHTITQIDSVIQILSNAKTALQEYQLGYNDQNAVKPEPKTEQTVEEKPKPAPRKKPDNSKPEEPPAPPSEPPTPPAPPAPPSPTAPSSTPKTPEQEADEIVADVLKSTGKEPKKPEEPPTPPSPSAEVKAPELANVEATDKALDDKKADIERRRQEELKERVVYDRRPTVDDGEFKIIGDPNNRIFRVNKNTGRPQVLDESNGLWSNTEESPNLFFEIVTRSGFQKSKDKINAKYDAEIDALENQPTISKEQTEPTKEEPKPATPSIPKTPEKAVPDAESVNAEAEEARVKGQKTIDGVKYTRREPLKEGEEVILGKQGKSTFKPGEATGIPFIYGLVDMNRIETTQKGVVENQNNFIPESQPKPISETRDLENKDRAAQFENELIGPSGSNPFLGSVNVNSRGEVFQGTGRWNILNYNKNKAARIEYLKSISKETGITPEQIDAFVAANPNAFIDIVKVYDVNDSQAIRLGNYDVKESETTPKGTAIKQAVSKITAPTATKLQAILGEAAKADKYGREAFKDKGKDILDELQKSGVLSPTEYSNMFNSEGDISTDGIDYIEDLMVEFALPTNGRALGKLPATAKNGVVKAIPSILAVPEKDRLTESLDRAIKAAYQAEKSGVTNIAQWANQKDGATGKIPKDVYTPLELAIAEILLSKSENQIAGNFRGYLDKVMGKSDLFSNTPPMNRVDASLDQFGVMWTDPASMRTDDKISIGGTEADAKDAVKEKSSRLSRLKKKDDIRDGEFRETRPTAADNKENQQEIDNAYESTQKYTESVTTASDNARSFGEGLKKKFDKLRGRVSGPARKRRILSPSERIRKEGFVNVIGTVVEGIQDLAELFSITRNSRIEQGTVVYLKEGKVVSFSVYSSGLIDRTAAPASYRAAEAKALGADSYYLIHNHPSGNPQPSNEDINYTQEEALRSASLGMTFKGSLVLNGGTFYQISPLGETKSHPYSARPLHEQGTVLRSTSETAEFARQIIEDTQSPITIVFFDTQGGIIDWHPVPLANTAEEMTSYIRGLYKSHGGAVNVIIGERNLVDGILQGGVKIPYDTDLFIDPVTGETRTAERINKERSFRSSQSGSRVRELLFMDAAGNTSELNVTESDTTFNEDTQPQLDAEVVEEMRGLVIDTIKAGQSISLKSMIKELIAEDLEHFVPELVQAYKDVKSTANLSVEVLNSMDTFERINSYDVESIKQEYEREQEKRAQEAAAQFRRAATLSELGGQSEPIYSGGVSVDGGGGSGRPDLRYAASTRLGDYGSNAVKEVIVEGQYASIDEHQRYAINMMLTRFKSGKESFLLADGTGVGKSLEQLVAAIEIAKMTGKPSLIITQSKAIIQDNFKAKGERELLGLFGGAFGVRYATYSDLSAGKIDTNVEYGAVFLDEAHNVKNPLSKRGAEVRNIKRTFTVFATATPMDKPQHLEYFMPSLAGMSVEDLRSYLGYEIEVREDFATKEPRIDSYIENIVEYTQRLIELRNNLIEEGAMIRREYPFYGTIENVIVPVPNMEEVIELEAELEAITKKKIHGLRQVASKNKWSPQQLEDKIRQQYETRGNEASRLVEGAKLPFVLSEISNELGLGRKVIVVVDSVQEDITLKKLGKEIPSLTSQLAQKMSDKGVRHGFILGADQKAKMEAAEQFQAGNLDVIIMTSKSGGTGIDLDDTMGDSPRTLIYVTPDYSVITLQQVLGRPSRRNTKSPTKAVFVYTNTDSDIRRRKNIDVKVSVLQAIQNGRLSEVVDTDGLRSRDHKKMVREIALPQIEMTDKGFAVLNAYPIKDILKSMGGFYHGSSKTWRFKADALVAVQEVIDNLAADSDVTEDIDTKFDNAVNDLLNSLNSGELGMGISPEKMFKLIKVAYYGVLKGYKNFNEWLDGITIGNLFPELVSAARQAWMAVKGAKNINVPKRDFRDIYSKLSVSDKARFNAVISRFMAQSNDIQDLIGLLDAVVIQINSGLNVNPNARVLGPSLAKYVNMLRSSALSLTDAEIIRKTNVETAETEVAKAMLDGAVNKKQRYVSRWFDKLKNIRQYLHAPYSGLSRFFEVPIRNEYGIPYERMKLERQAELLKGYRGQAMLNAEQIRYKVLGTITINGQKSPKLSRLERELFEQYLFAMRAKDRAEKGRSTGNVTAVMAEAMLDVIRQRLPDSRSFEDFEHRGKVFQEVMDNNLKLLLASGRIGQAQYDGIKEKNDFYATFNVIQSTDYDGAGRMDTDAISTEANVIMRIKGIAKSIASDYGIPEINQLVFQLNNGIITLDEFYSSAMDKLDKALVSGVISEKQYAEAVTILGTAGFEVTSILGAAEQILYRSVFIARKNELINEVAKIARLDISEKFARIETVATGANVSDYDTGQDKAVVFYEDGVKKVVVMDRMAAETLAAASYPEIKGALKIMQYASKILRLSVVVTSVKYQIANLLLYDMFKTLFGSRAGILAGIGTKSRVKNTAINLVALPFDILSSILEGAAANVFNERDIASGLRKMLAARGINFDVDGYFASYKQFMESPAYSQGVIGGEPVFAYEARSNKFTDKVSNDNVIAKIAKLAWTFAQSVLGIGEVSGKLLGVKRMNRLLKQQIADGTISAQDVANQLEQSSYEVRTQIASPDFANMPASLRGLSIFFPMLASRLKGIAVDTERFVSAITLGMTSKDITTKRQAYQDFTQYALLMSTLAFYAINLFGDDDDEKEDVDRMLSRIDQKVLDDNIVIPLDREVDIPISNYNKETKSYEGYLVTTREMITIPVRGFNGMLWSIMRASTEAMYYGDASKWNKVAQKAVQEYSPINITGNSPDDVFESVMSGINPIIKGTYEVMANRNTYTHSSNVSPYLIQRYNNGIKDLNRGVVTMDELENDGIAPWQIGNSYRVSDNEVAISKWLWESGGITMTANSVNVYLRSFGLDEKGVRRRVVNPIEGLRKNLLFSEKTYPLNREAIFGEE